MGTIKRMLVKSASVLLIVLMLVGSIVMALPEDGVWMRAEALTPAFDEDPNESKKHSEEYKQSVYYEKLKAIELTGNQRDDIVKVAKSQINYHEGSSNKDLGGSSSNSGNYTEYGRNYGLQGSEWCAMFVWWCAKQANISCIGYNAWAGYALDLGKDKEGNNITNGFGYTHKAFNDYVNYAKGGDIAFVNNDNDSLSDHVGLVVGMDANNVYTVEGNASNKVSYLAYNRKTGICTTASGTSICFFSVPNYSGSDSPTPTSTPTTPTNLTSSKNHYTSSESIGLTWDSVQNATEYWVEMKKDGVLLYRTNNRASTAFTSAPTSVGVYTFSVFAKNSVGESAPAEYSFMVYDNAPDTVTNLRSDKQYYSSSDSIFLTWNETPFTTKYYYSLYKGDVELYNGYHTNTAFTSAPTSTGDYTFYVRPGNDFGFGALSSCSFTVSDDPPRVATNLKSDKSYYTSSESIFFTWDETPNTTRYYYSMYKGDVMLYDGYHTGTAFTSAPTSPGNYTFYIRPGNDYGFGELSSCTFIVSDDPPGATSNLKSDKLFYTSSERISLTWDETPNTTRYYFSMYKGDVMLYDGYHTGTAFTSAPTSPGNYTFYIRPGNDFGFGELSSCTFIVGDDPPGAANNLKSDKSFYTSSERISLTWDETPCATSYYFCMYKDDIMLYEGHHTGTSFTSAPTSPGEYIFIIIPSNNFGYGEAASCLFVVSDSVPEAPQNLLGDKEQLVISDEITFTWDVVSNIYEYCVEVWKDGTNIYVGGTELNTTFAYTPTATGKYFFCVFAKNHIGYSEGAYYHFTVIEENDVYTLTPNIVAGASKLYEPWGLRYFATYTGEDADHIANRGIAILKDEFYNESMTAEEFCANEKVHIFTTAQDNLDYETSSERYYATLTKGIYSYDIASLYYVVPFAEMDNGQVIYGTIKKNSMEKILNANLGSSIITAAEKAVCTCILDLKDTVAKHYAANGVPMAETEQVIARGADQTAAPAVKTTSDAGVTPNIVAGASRMIEPWGLRYRATYTGANTADISEYGMVILCDKYYDSAYASSPDRMRTNANAYVYTYENGSGTLEYSDEDGRYSAILTEGVTSKDIADVYYVVPFVVLSDGSYVYGTVKSNSMLKIMNTNLGLTSVSATEKAVTQDIIDLYNAVKEYYAS